MKTLVVRYKARGIDIFPVRWTIVRLHGNGRLYLGQCIGRDLKVSDFGEPDNTAGSRYVIDGRDLLEVQGWEYNPVKTFGGVGRENFRSRLPARDGSWSL